MLVFVPVLVGLSNFEAELKGVFIVLKNPRKVLTILEVAQRLVRKLQR